MDVQAGVVLGAHERDTVFANIGSLIEKARREGIQGLYVTQRSNKPLGAAQDEAKRLKDE